MKYTIEEFMDNDFVVRCNTQDEAGKLLEILRAKGVKWCTGDVILDTYWETYKDETCYEVDSYGLQFADIECFAEDDYTIIRFYDLNERESEKGNMKALTNDLITQNYTYIAHEEDFKFNAPHHFKVYRKEDGTKLCDIDFQEGAIKESGVNGITNEDVIAMVIARLEGFQHSEFSSRDNAIVITHLEDALLRLRKRTIGRENRGVEGLNIV